MPAWLNRKERRMTAGNNTPRTPESSAKPVEPATMCVNMTYDPGPFTQAEREAARRSIESEGELKRARKILREHGELTDDGNRNENR